MTNAALTIDNVKSIAADRVALCDMYINRNKNCLRGQQWVVVSTLWNRRIVHNMVIDGKTVMVISPSDMPTSYSRKDAESLVREINADPDCTDTVKLVHDTDWWQIEKAEAELVLSL